MIQRHEHEAHRRLQHDREAADHEIRSRLLDDQDVEVTVEQGPHAEVLEKRVDGKHGAQRYLRHHAGVKPALEQVHDVDPQRPQQARQQQQHEQPDGQHHERERQPRVGHRVDEHLHRDRDRERQQADAYAVNDGERKESGLGSENDPKESKQLAQRSLLVKRLIAHTRFVLMKHAGPSGVEAEPGSRPRQPRRVAGRVAELQPLPARVDGQKLRQVYADFRVVGTAQPRSLRCGQALMRPCLRTGRRWSRNVD